MTDCCQGRPEVCAPAVAAFSNPDPAAREVDHA
jgi:ArsR family transcriptional regulator, arsenate/arsenite/antimonite-responsive transcriptional repressor